MPSSAPAVTPASPSLSATPPQPLVNKGSAPSAADVVDLDSMMHWGVPKKPAPAPEPPLPVIEIPHGTGSNKGSSSSRGAPREYVYTSLQDIMSSPDYVPRGEVDIWREIESMRNPLLKHAARVYMRMTPREEPPRRNPFCRLFLDCISFIGDLFRPDPAQPAEE